MDGKNLIKVETKIGTVSVSTNEIINFNEGPLGFAEYKDFIIVEEEEDSLFLILQSVDNPELAFPVLEVDLLNVNLTGQISKDLLDQMKAQKISELSIYTIVAVPSNFNNMTANLRAPVLINNKTKMGLQVILSDQNLEIARPIFKDLRTRLTGSSSNVTSKDTIRKRNKSIAVMWKEKGLDN
jgi:flagellar assembly factor FliW